MPFCKYGHAQISKDEFEIKFTKYTVSTKSCTKIVHITGSLIFIPEDAFALDPRNVVDSLDIYYREIRTPLDMIIQGIPMICYVAGKPFYLESNGMFEIWAKLKSDTINIHEDKSIEVRLAMQPAEVDYRMEGFKFDNNSNQWKSYTNRLNNSTVYNTDDDLWGSAPIQNDQFIEEEVDPEWARQDSIRKVAFQAMEIFDFGLYNYDKIIDNETFISLKASFVNTDNKMLSSTIFIVYEEINSVFQYPPYNWENDFSIIENKSYSMFTIDKEGRISSLNNFPVLKEISGKEYEFKLETEEAAPESRQELAHLTGLR